MIKVLKVKGASFPQLGTYLLLSVGDLPPLLDYIFLLLGPLRLLLQLLPHLFRNELAALHLLLELECVPRGRPLPLHLGVARVEGRRPVLVQVDLDDITSGFDLNTGRN